MLVHDYPLSGRVRDRQLPARIGAGHRVITYPGDAEQAVALEKTGKGIPAFASDAQPVTISAARTPFTGLTPSRSMPRCCSSPARPPADGAPTD